jgi:hypothetical protein
LTNLEELQQRYAAAAHAIQTGVAYELEIDSASGTPKHLRTGLNVEMVSHGALVRLLIAKGVCTEEEYFEEVVKGLEDEQCRYEERLSAHYGGTIKLK